MSGKSPWLNRVLLALLCVAGLFTAGCYTQRVPRVTLVTGTTIGLKATPGDGTTRPPQVTLGYKRAETALVPTKGEKATKDPTHNASDSDAFSTLAAFFFQTEWFGNTEIASFIATGHSARIVQQDPSEFNHAFAMATLGVVPEDIQARRVALIQIWNSLDETQSQRILDVADYPTKSGKTAKESLQDAIKDAQTGSQLMKLESAFQRVL